MPEIATYVFFDIETTGLPWQEKNKTKITEASFVAVRRHDLEASSYGTLPVVSKLTFLLNPEKPICREVTKLNGLSNRTLRKAPTFCEKLADVKSFLANLPKPVCLVAHNGNAFDFKILLAELNDINSSLPSDLLCVDSLPGFRTILKSNNYYPATQNLQNQSPNVELESSQDVKDLLSEDDDMMTDDEDEWPDLNISSEEWQTIDAAAEKVSYSYKLTDLYKRLLNKQQDHAHRAEVDCLMLLECVVAVKDFLTWADNNCQLLTGITPLNRNYYPRYKRNKENYKKYSKNVTI